MEEKRDPALAEASPDLEEQGDREAECNDVAETQKEKRSAISVLHQSTLFCLVLLAGLIVLGAYLFHVFEDQVEGRVEKRVGVLFMDLEADFVRLFEEQMEIDRLRSQEILALAKTSLEEKGELNSRIAILASQADSLSLDLDQSRKNERRLKDELQRLQITMDRERRALKEKEGLLDEAINLVNSGKTDGPDSDSGSEQTEAGDVSGQQEKPDPAITELLAGLNALLDEYTDAKIKIADCKGLEGRGLESPLIQLAYFRGEGPIVMLPEILSFTHNHGLIKIMCFGGTYSREGGVKKQIPITGLEISEVMLDEDEEISKPLLRRVLGLDEFSPSLSLEEKAKREGKTIEEVVLEKLNELLSEEQRGMYKFLSIKDIRDNLLLEVELEQYASGGRIDHLVVAETCEVNLIEKYKYVEFLFSNGVVVREGKKKPFYNNLYRLPIPNIDNALWMDSGLEFITLK